MGRKLYTIEEIKKAYWSEFRGCGELFFSYFGSDEDIDKETEGFWQEFKEALEKTKNDTD